MGHFISSHMLLLTIVIQYHPGIYASQNNVHFKIQTNKKIKEEYTYRRTTTMSLIHCANECVRNISCMSAAYSERACHLSIHIITRQEDQYKLSVDASWISISKPSCPDDWISLLGTCYFLVELGRTFTVAQSHCNEIGGKLTEPQSNGTFQYIRKYKYERKSATRWLRCYQTGPMRIRIVAPCPGSCMMIKAECAVMRTCSRTYHAGGSRFNNGVRITYCNTDLCNIISMSRGETSASRDEFNVARDEVNIVKDEMQ